MAQGKCSRCKEVFTSKNSGKWNRNKGCGWCYSCHKLWEREWRKNNPLKHILSRTKNSAKKRGLKFELTLDDLPPIPDFCPVFPWIRLVYNVGQGRKHGSVSLDRIDNNLGYTKENIRFISDRANILRRDATNKELSYLFKDVESRVKT